MRACIQNIKLELELKRRGQFASTLGLPPKLCLAQTFFLALQTGSVDTGKAKHLEATQTPAQLLMSFQRTIRQQQ